MPFLTLDSCLGRMAPKAVSWSSLWYFLLLQCSQLFLEHLAFLRRNGLNFLKIAMISFQILGSNDIFNSNVENLDVVKSYQQHLFLEFLLSIQSRQRKHYQILKLMDAPLIVFICHRSFNSFYLSLVNYNKTNIKRTGLKKFEAINLSHQLEGGCLRDYRSKSENKETKKSLKFTTPHLDRTHPSCSGVRRTRLFNLEFRRPSIKTN